MAKIRLTLPGLEIPVTGKQVTFKAPCDCSIVECIEIDGVDYTVVDTMGNVVTGSPAGGTWSAGAKVSVILDVDDRKAYLLNGASSPMMVGTTDPTADTAAPLGRQYWNDTDKTMFVCTGIENGEYIWTSLSTQKKVLKTEIITASTDWVVPHIAGDYVYVRCFGGGGGGGAYYQGTAGGGGGGGHMAYAEIPVSSLGSVVGVIIGAGGAGGAYDWQTAAGSGGVTSFGGFVSAAGGSGGSSTGVGGDGGTGGGAAGHEDTDETHGNRKGGNASYGGGGGGGWGYQTSTNGSNTGGNGGTYGGGGGAGGGHYGSGTPSKGGTGGTYGGNGGYGGNRMSSAAPKPTTGGDGTDTSNLGVDFPGTGKGGAVYISAGGQYCDDGGGGGGGGYGGEGGKGYGGGGGGGGYGGKGGNGAGYVNTSYNRGGGGGGGGYGGAGKDGLEADSYSTSGAGGGGGGYGISNFGSGGNGRSPYVANAKGHPGTPGVCIIQYYVYEMEG